MQPEFGIWGGTTQEERRSLGKIGERRTRHTTKNW